MQEKLQDILQSAKGWLTASEIAERGNWRSAKHVGLALKQMADVSHRSSPTKKMHNGMPAKEYKLSYRMFEGDAVAPTIVVDATAPAVKDPLTTQPAAPVVRNSRTTEMPTDKECCNAAKVVATTASEAVADMKKEIADLKEEVSDYERIVVMVRRTLGIKEGDSIKLAIEKLQSDLGHARTQVGALNEQLMAGEDAVDLKDAAKGYLVCAPKRKPAKLMKAESAVARAKSAAKTAGRCEVFALVPVGVATRKIFSAVEFKERAA